MKNNKSSQIIAFAAMLLSLLPVSLLATVGNDTWNGAGADNNWLTAANWTAGSANKPPGTNDILFFDGTTRLTANNNYGSTTNSVGGITFNSTAGAFVLTGNSVTNNGGTVDNSSVNTETVNIPMVLPSTHSVTVVSGGSMLLGGVISGAGGINKYGGGMATLTNANTYTNITAILAGTLTLDFSAAGAPAVNIVKNTSALSLSGGTLNIVGAASGTTAQTNASLVLYSGGSTIAVSSGASGTSYLNVGAITRNNTSTVKVNLPSSGNVFTTTGTASTVLTGGTGSATYAFVTDSSGNVTDFAAKDSGNTFIGAGATQAAAQYSSPSGSGNVTISGTYGTAILDVTSAGGATGIRLGSSLIVNGGIRFAASGAWFIDSASAGRLLSTTAFLVTSGVGANNVTISGPGGIRQSTSGGDLIFMQDNTSGELLMTGGAMTTGSSSSSTSLVKAGRGTMNVSTAQYYTGQSYINEGVFAANQDGALGAVASGVTVNLNGGTLLGTANFTLDNAGANLRAVYISTNGGALAAAAATSMTVDGVVSGATATAPLTIGIPASSANGSIAGQVPGTGTGTANTAINATGTVILSGGNTYSGGTVLRTGTVNINGINALGGANYGGLTFNGGTLQYSNTLTSGTDLSTGSGITISSGGGTIDVNGNNVIFANAIGNSGSGALTVQSTTAGGSLTLSNANTYTGNTTVSGGKLKLGSTASLASTNFTVSSGAIFDVSAVSFTLAAGQTLFGGGVVTGNVATASSANIIPGTLLGTSGSILSFSNNLSLAANTTNYIDLSGTAGGANDQIVVANLLTLPASGKSYIAINFTATPTAGRYKLFTYGTLGGGTVAANLTTNVFTGNSIGVLTPSLDNTVAGEIDLVLTSAHTATAITWIGDGGPNNWDTTSPNWSSPTTHYFDSDFVTFDDSGSTTPAVNLTTVLAPGSVTVNSVNNYTFSGPGSIGTGSLTKSNTDNLIITTTNSLPGPIVIQGGTLQLGDGVNAGTIGTGNITNNATLVMNSPTTVTTGPITGTGNTTIDVGTLAIGGNSTLGSLTLGGSSTSGTLDMSGKNVNVTGLTLGSGATGGAITNSGATVTTNLLTVNSSVDSSYAGTIGGNLAGSKIAVLKNGAGTLTLSGANTFSGGITISNGVVAISQDAALGTSAIILSGGTLSNTAAFSINDHNLTVPSGTNGLLVMGAGNAKLPNLYGGGALGVDVQSTAASINAANHEGNALSACANFTGMLNVTGIVASAGMSCFFNGGSFDGQLQNATVNLNTLTMVGIDNTAGNTAQFGALNVASDATLGGSVVAGTLTYQIGALGGNSDIEGGVTGNGALIKVGIGNLILGNSGDTYTGKTLVNAGTLTVNGDITASATTNYSGTTLAGNGSLYSVDMESGSTLSPGVGGVGALACTGGLVLQVGCTNLMDVTSSGVDSVTVTGGLTLNGGTVQLNISSLPSDGNYTLIAYDSISGSVGNLTLTPLISGSRTFTLIDTGTGGAGQIQLVVATVGNASLTWESLANAASSIWNTSDINWTNSAANDLEKFINGDTVTFNNVGSDNTSVSLSGSLLPTGVNVAGTANYTFATTSGGKISGAMTNGLVKTGASTLTILTGNNYTGPTTISGGVVQVGDGTTTGTALSAGNVTNNALLVFNQPDSSSIASLTGTGNLQIVNTSAVGTGKLIINGNATYSGTNLIDYSTLQLGNGGSTAIPTNSFTLADHGTVTFDVAGNYTVTNTITGAGNVGFAGSSTNIFGGVHTYTDSTYIYNGLVKLQTANAIPSAATVSGSLGWLIMDGGTTAGTLDLNGFNQTVNALSGLTGTALGKITNSATATGTNVLTITSVLGENVGFAGNIAENSTGTKIALVLNGNGTQSLSGSNAFSGGVTVNSSTEILAIRQAASVGTGMITLMGGGTLSNTASLNLYNVANLTVPASQTGVFSMIGNCKMPNLYGPGTLGLAVGSATIGGGSGSYGLALGNCVNFTGILNATGTVANATLVLDYNNTGGFTGDGRLDGATVNLYNGVRLGALPYSAGSIWQLGAVNVDSTSALTGGYVAGGGTVTYVIGALGTASDIEGVVSNGPSSAAAIIKVGGGTLTLGGVNTYTGNTTISNGTILVSGSGQLGGGTYAGNVTNYGTFNYSSSAGQTLSGIVSGTGALVQNGSGQLTLSGANTYTGNTTVNAGTLEIANADIATNSTVTVAGGAFLQLDFSTTNLVKTLVLGSTSEPAGVYGNGNSGGLITGSGYLQVASSGPTGPATITNSISGSTLSLSWPAGQGWRLVSQTNDINTGLTTNWFTVPGVSGNSATITVNPSQPTVFYELVYP